MIVIIIIINIIFIITIIIIIIIIIIYVMDGWVSGVGWDGMRMVHQYRAHGQTREATERHENVC